MTRQNPQDTNDEVQLVEDQVYGEEMPGGTNTRPGAMHDTEQALENVTGNDPTAVDSEGKVVDDHIAQEIEKDEKDLTGTPVIQDPNPNNDNQSPTNLDENLGQDEAVIPVGVSEDLANSTQDPFEALTDESLGINKKPS